MSIIRNLFKRRDDGDKKNAGPNETLKDKYHHFQNLLEHNDKVLMLIADLEDKLKSEYLFDQQYIKVSVESLSQGVSSIITSLNSLSFAKYQTLQDRFVSIRADIDNIVSPGRDIPVSDLVIPFDRLGENMSGIAGGKIARLGDLKNRLMLPAPDGFSITAYAFKRFLEHNRLVEKINSLLHHLTAGNLEEIDSFSRTMRNAVMEAELPADLQNAITTALANLKSGDQQHPLMVSVRSSAIQEDGQFSFAGQYATFLNVPADQVALKYKEVVASIFRPRAVFYFKTKGFSEAEMVMSVGVVRMIDAAAGGVVYTKDPNDPDSDRIIINAAWGLGKVVVDGAVTPHTYVVARSDRSIVETIAADQRVMLLCADGGGITEVPVPPARKDAACLTHQQIQALTAHAAALEAHYGKPQDIEWAIDRNGNVFLLQSRALKTFTGGLSQRTLPRRLEHYPILIDKGLIASKGIGYGRACIVKDDADIRSFPEGGVLVATAMSADFVLVMEKAAAMVIDKGSITGHMASLAREYAIPTLVETGTATRSIQPGQEITVDAVNCNVYEGKAVELLKYSAPSSAFRDTRVFKTLERAFELIAPLNLVDPASDTFSPEHCRTFHDITRFSHEKAMIEMFSIGADHDMDECRSVPLKAGIPIDAHLIDLGGGLAENITKATSADIRSLPFAAFLKGMKTMKWPEPRPADVGGFLGMIANTAAIPEQQLRETGERSYAVISGNYMNFSIRLGYHFSAVEAYVGESVNENYIKFHFKGGGAATDRRLRRIRLITEILKKMDFTVQIKEDVMNALLPKFARADTLRRLEIMGKLTAYTKQLDMAMYNDAVTDLFIEDFVRDHMDS